MAFIWQAILESCIQTSSVKANFGVGVTRTKILLYWLKDFHFQPRNYRKLQKWNFFLAGGKMTAEWRAEHAQWYGKLETCMIWALIDYIYTLSVHCLRFYVLCWDSTVHELMWRLRGFHLLLLSDKFHWNFCFPDPPKKLFKKKTELCTIMSAYIWMNSFFSSIMDSTLTRASDRSRKKKANFAGFLGTNSWKNWPILREFCGRF